MCETTPLEASSALSTRAECQAGVGEIGIKDRKEGVKTFLQYRLLCLDHIESFFDKLKIRKLLMPINFSHLIFSILTL